MDEKHKNIIQTSFVYLTKNIHNVMQICDHLVSKEVLTYGMVDSIKYKSPAPTAQVRELLSILPRRGKKAYECFIEALSETENKDAADFLKSKEDPNYTPDSKKSKSTEDIQESTETHSGGGENSKKLNAPPGVDWPDLGKGIKLVQSKDIQKTTDKELEKIVRTRNVYNMTGSKKGKVIIISNVKCASESGNNENCGCPGTETESKSTDVEAQNNQAKDRYEHCSKSVDFDKTNIQQLFRYMKFDITIPNKNMTRQEILKLLQETANKDESYDSVVVVILSGGQSYDPMQIYDKNGEKVEREEIVKIIRDSPAFKGKPKLVIYRTYNFEDNKDKDKESPDTLDATGCNIRWPTVSNDDDLFVVTAVPKIKHGPWIVGDNMHGSYFIQALMHVFKDQAQNKPFVDLLEEVNNCLQKAMVPNDKDKQKGTRTAVAEVVVLEYSKNKDLYFFPKIIDKTESTATVKETQPKGNALTTAESKPEPTPCDIKVSNCSGWPDLINGCSFKKKDLKTSTWNDYETVTKQKQIYDMINGTKKGKLIWISNIACPGNMEKDIEEERITECRKNCDTDKTSMDQFLKAVGFECGPKDRLKDATEKEIKTFLKEELAEIDKDKIKAQYSCLVVMIMSGKVDCQPRKIYDKDGNLVHRQDIYDIIRQSKHFHQKPKIVIIQSYNFKEEPPYDTTDSSTNELIVKNEPNNYDLFVVSTYPRIEKGPWMIGNNVSGSYFIQALIHVFKRHSYEKSFLELLKEVHKCLQSALVPELKGNKYDDQGKPTRVADVMLLEYSKEKELFFFPGLSPPNSLLPFKQKNDFSSSLRGRPVAQPADDSVEKSKGSQEFVLHPSDVSAVQSSLETSTLQILSESVVEQNAEQTCEKSDTVPPDDTAVVELSEEQLRKDTKSSTETTAVATLSASDAEQIIVQTSENSNTVPPDDTAVAHLLGDTVEKLPNDGVDTLYNVK